MDLLPIPYAYSEMSGVRHLSVSTQTSVFFVVNPSLAMFKGFASGCITQGQVWKTQLSALSSYAPIRIWKIDPYEFCPVGADGSARCAPGHVAFRDIPDSFVDIHPEGAKEDWNVFDYRKCAIPFSVAVTSLEYLNQENIAVTVLYSPLSEYNLNTFELLNSTVESEYRIMFLSTFSMALRDTPWNRDVQTSQATQGQLCAAMRRIPNLGSLSTELLVAGVNLLRPIVSILVSLPGLIKIWGEDRKCALSTKGHSLLQKCGSEILSLDDFFDAINRANSHYWSSFNKIASGIRGAGQYKLANVVDGIAYYGDATSSPMGIYSSTINSVKIPIGDIGGMITR